MKLREGFISFILAAAMFAGAVPVSAAAENEAEIAQRLRRLGAVYDLEDETSEDLSAAVSRGEWAKILVKYIAKTQIKAEVEKKPYADVELDDPYVRDIKALKDMGFVSDIEALRYRPADNITLGEAGVMMVRSFGYDHDGRAAEIAASQMGLFDGISKSMTEEATLGDIYRMLYNGFDAEFFDAGLYNANGNKMTNADTLLERYYDLEKKRGIITANEYTSLSEPDGGAGEAMIAIDGEAYYLKDNEFSKYIGYLVDYYVSDDDEILYIAPNKKNIVTYISADDIDDNDDYSITYYADEEQKKTKKLRLDKNFDCIYNGKAYSGYGSLENLLPENGSVTAVDNDGNGSADVIIIEEFEYYLVKGTDSVSQKVYCNSSDVVLDLSDNAGSVDIRDAKGSKRAITAIRADMVLSVAQSKNTGEKLIRVIISEETVSGVVKSLNEEKIVIGSSEFDCVNELWNKVKNGSSGIFRITHDGKAAFYSADSSLVWKTGVVFRIYETDDERIETEIYTSSGEFVRYLIYENASLGATVEHNELKGDDKILINVSKGDVVRYKLNGTGQISNIQTADPGQKNKNNTKTYASKESLRLISEGNDFYGHYDVINGSFGVSPDTIYFIIPKNDEEWDRERFSNVSVISASRYNYSYPYKAYKFDDDDNPVADILLLRGDESGSISTSSNLCVVDKVADVWTNDKAMSRISVYAYGAKANYICDPSLIKTYDIKQGDIIRVSTDSLKEVKSISKILNADGSGTGSPVIVPGTKHTNGNTYKNEGRIVYGKVTRKGPSFMEFDYSAHFDASELNTGWIGQCKFVRYDSSKKEIDISSADELMIGDKFVALISVGMVREIVIIK